MSRNIDLFDQLVHSGDGSEAVDTDSTDDSNLDPAHDVDIDYDNMVEGL